MKMPPPPVPAVLPEIVELMTVRVPEFLKAPPLPEVWAPETVTPEMDKSPPEAMLKILKLPLLPSMVSKEAPRPLMPVLPAVPLPTTVLASTIVGNADPSVIVFTPVKLKLI